MLQNILHIKNNYQQKKHSFFAMFFFINDI